MGNGEAVWRQRLRLLRLLRRVPRRWLAALLGVTTVTAVVPAGFAVGVGLLISRVPAGVDQGLSSPQGRALLVAVGVVAGVIAFERLSVPVSEVVHHRVGRDIDGAIRADLLSSFDRQPGLAPLEDGRTHAELGVVEGGLFGTAGTAAVAAVGVIGRYLQTVLALAVVAWFSIPLALLVGAVIVAIRRRWQSAFSALADGIITSATELGKVQYIAGLAAEPAAAKEIRIFGLVDWLVGRSRSYWDAAVAVPLAVRRRLRRSANVELALLAVAYALTFVLVARDASDGRVGLGLVAAILQAEFAAAQLIAPTVEDFATAPGVAALRAAEVLEDRLQPSSSVIGAASADGLPRRSIRFEDVSFAYPGTDQPVLDGLDLTIEAGESVALVGLNGAGKTTLVKLLCGLYSPQRGSILIDGVSLAELDLVSWRQRIAVIFQDFVRYELSAADNVAVGAVNLDRRRDALDTAARHAGASSIVEKLPAGWDTVLSRQYPGGADLSGGEWQRVALARALFAVFGGAGVLVLDEPTANLDVRAEAELFDRFLDWKGDTTALLISHRFSSVRRAERVLVLDDGQIIESGSHDTLLAYGGRYAELFRIQAERFRDADPDAAASPRPRGATDA